VHSMNSKISNYISIASQLANDNTHGYSQINRWGVDYDCSSFVITCVQNAGIPVKTNGATYTGNMYNAFIKSGFTDVTSKVNLVSGVGLNAGDILIATGKHTEIYIGNYKLCGAHKDCDGKTGDSTGKEISIQGYYNYPWDVVLRYTRQEKTPGGITSTSASGDTTSTNTDTTSTSADTTSTQQKYVSQYAQYFSKELEGRYANTRGVNMRFKNDTTSDLIVYIPAKKEIVCYGYYSSGTSNYKWLYAQYYDGKTTFTGFVHNKYLIKIAEI